VTVVGSGFTGIELATELAARFHVVLLERAEVLAPSLGDGPRETIAQALDKVGVEVRLGATLDRIDGSTTVWCGGMVANPLTLELPAERDPLGRLITEPSLAVRGLPGVYAAGDVAYAMADDAHEALMSCQHAIKLGQFAGHNALSDLLGQPTLPYRQPIYRMCLDLGGAGAVYETLSIWEFLKPVAAVAASLTLPADAGKGKTVSVLGAGVSGLCAAYELDRAGFDVVILEPQRRAGGQPGYGQANRVGEVSSGRRHHGERSRFALSYFTRLRWCRHGARHGPPPD
jgi:NADH dehydrogenase FAD-containing subunit